jgi:hypothetical protein
VDIPSKPPEETPEEDQLAFAEALLKSQDGDETPVECGYCNQSFPFRTTRLLLAEDYGGVPESGERHIFVCESCWWDLIGNPRREALREVITDESEQSGAADPGAPLDELELVADLKRREDEAGPGESG